MLSVFLQWLFSFKFTQNTSAAVLGTAITAAPLFGILDTRLTKEITEVKESVETKATIVYVDHKNEVTAINVKKLIDGLEEIKESQKTTNSQLWQLVNKGR